MKINYLVAAYIAMLLVIFILPFYSAEGYSVVHNTTSELGAQHTPNAWIMNVVFAALGLFSILEGWKHLGRYYFHKGTLVLFGGALILAALFRHEPLDPNLPYDVRENELHSIFATLTGFGFTLFAISVGFIKPTLKEKTIPITIGVVATLLSGLMFTVDEFRGIWQRLIFILSFGWMIWEFHSKK